MISRIRKSLSFRKHFYFLSDEEREALTDAAAATACEISDSAIPNPEKSMRDSFWDRQIVVSFAGDALFDFSFGLADAVAGCCFLRVSDARSLSSREIILS